MNPGRNDPCPCGSGKKYKKCCLDNENRVVPKAVRDVEPRFYSPATSFYSQGAIAEALKPGGRVHIHPYALIKLRDDPRLADAATPGGRRNLEKLWSPSKLAAMPTEEIQIRCTRIGVNYQQDEFFELAKSRYSAWDISKEWAQHLQGLPDSERDFLGLAACELWRRLCPERPSIEMIDDWLCEGYGFSAIKKPAEALAAWWRVWQTLHSRLDPNIRNLHDAGKRYFDGMSQCLSNWSQDFRMEALNSAMHDPRCGEIGTRFISEILQALPEENEDLNFLGDLAMIYQNLGRDAEAEQCCQSLMQDHPDFAIGYVTLSDGLLRNPDSGAVEQSKVQRAIKLLEQALAVPVKDADAFDISSRLEDANKLLHVSNIGGV
jgi:hypothetical protein